MRNKDYMVVLLILTTFLISCKDKAGAKNEDSVPRFPGKQILIDSLRESELLNQAVNKGDCNAYKVISNFYFLHYKVEELFYYSYKMANKFQCPDAYYDIYQILNFDATINGRTIYVDDEFSKDYSIYCLLKSKELGFENAHQEIENLFKDSIVPNSTIYLKKLIK